MLVITDQSSCVLANLLCAFSMVEQTDYGLFEFIRILDLDTGVVLEEQFAFIRKILK